MTVLNPLFVSYVAELSQVSGRVRALREMFNKAPAGDATTKASPPPERKAANKFLANRRGSGAQGTVATSPQL